jgi:hypothetical protein
MKKVSYSVMTPELFSDIMTMIRSDVNNPTGNTIYFNCSNKAKEIMGNLMMTDLRFVRASVQVEAEGENCYGTIGFQGNNIIVMNTLSDSKARTIIVCNGRTVLELIQV